LCCLCGVAGVDQNLKCQVEAEPTRSKGLSVLDEKTHIRTALPAGPPALQWLPSVLLMFHFLCLAEPHLY